MPPYGKHRQRRNILALQKLSEPDFKRKISPFITPMVRNTIYTPFFVALLTGG